MAVILNKDQKVLDVLSVLQEGYTAEEFVAKFKEIHPAEWLKLEKNYASHVRKAKPGKPVPMPKPHQYVLNALNVCLKKKQELP